jgi:hypothetical protein
VPENAVRRGAAADVAHADEQDGVAGGHGVVPNFATFEAKVRT